MITKLSQREKRMLVLGAACAAAILIFAYGSKWLEHWRRTRASLTTLRSKMQLTNVGKAKQAGLFSIVPVFETPRVEEEQKLLFRERLNEQLKRAGIRSEPLQVSAGGKSPAPGYELLRLKCSAECRFGQVLDLLAGLKENPYLVGVEEMRITCDKKKPPGQRQKVKLDLTVSTLVK